MPTEDTEHSYHTHCITRRLHTYTVNSVHPTGHIPTLYQHLAPFLAPCPPLYLSLAPINDNRNGLLNVLFLPGPRRPSRVDWRWTRAAGIWEYRRWNQTHWLLQEQRLRAWVTALSDPPILLASRLRPVAKHLWFWPPRPSQLHPVFSLHSGAFPNTPSIPLLPLQFHCILFSEN